MSEQWGRQIDFPPFSLHFHNAADDQVAYLGRVARAEGTDGEEFVGFEEGAGDGGDDLEGGGAGVGPVAAARR